MRSAMRAASQLPGGPLLWIWPQYLHVNKKSDDDDDDDATVVSSCLHFRSYYFLNVHVVRFLSAFLVDMSVCLFVFYFICIFLFTSASRSLPFCTYSTLHFLLANHIQATLVITTLFVTKDLAVKSNLLL